MEQLFALLNLLQPPPPGVLERLSSMLVRKQVKKKEFLLREGQVSSRIYFIEKGLIRAYYIEEKGEDVTTWFMKDNRILR